MSIIRHIGQLLAVACSFCFLLSNTHAAGLLKPQNAQYADLQIKQHHVDVQVDGAFSTTSIEQVFFNPNPQNLDAIYSFPVPEHAAVGEFIYWIDGKPIVGEVVEKKRAREIYHQEKQAGREVAIVEKDQYKTFDISIAAVPAQSEVKVRLVYLQSAKVDTGVGRYVYPLEDGGVDEERDAFWQGNDKVEESFTFNFALRSAYPVQAVRLPKHPNAQVQKNSDSEWQISLANGNPVHEEGSQQTLQPQIIRLNKDIVVYWRLQENLPGSIDVLTYKKDANSRGTFMLTLTPGGDLPVMNQGRDWNFVLDVSGSMDGKYSSLVEGVRKALNKLNSGDRVRIIAFNNSAYDLSRGYQWIDEQSVERLLKTVENYRPNGGTNLYAGIAAALNGLDADRPTGLVLVTDGVANVGTTEKKAFFNLLQKYDVRLFTFIMGNSANRPLLEDMTKLSNGFAASVSNSDDISGQLMLATSKLGHAAMNNVSLKLQGIRTNDIVPEHFSTLYRGEQLIVFGHYYEGGELDLSLNGNIAGQDKQYQARITLPAQDEQYPELERLWAYYKIQQMKAKMDFLGKDKDSEQAIADTAMEYGLVTDYTSMIVVRDEVFDALNIERKNKVRVEAEQKARQQRTTQHVQQQKSQPQQSNFSKSRPSLSSGGGAMNPLWLITLLLLVAARVSKRKGGGHE